MGSVTDSIIVYGSGIDAPIRKQTLDHSHMPTPGSDTDRPSVVDTGIDALILQQTLNQLDMTLTHGPIKKRLTCYTLRIAYERITVLL